jgi:hypothetical protein
MNTERDQFEAWCNAQFDETALSETELSWVKGLMYSAWQASREALKAEQEGAWIACSERVPENSQDVTMFSESKGVINGYYFGWNGEDKKWYAACGEYEGPEEGITHWQPLPEPPEKAP